MFIKKISVSLSALVLSFLISFSAFGDDLEIYLGSGSTAVVYKPNVLFIMDTSGSMNSKDGTNQSRMQRVQVALNEAIAQATNINAGLMRFSDFGGPVLYPVTDIDTPLPAELVAITQQSKDDAFEVNSSINTSDNKLTLTSGTKDVLTGLRYDSINIPQGAKITKAVLRFTSTNLSTAGADFEIFAEDNSSAAQYDSSNRISSRAKTTESLEWEVSGGFPLDDTTVLSPDFSNVVQELVDRSDWCGGSPINLIIEGKGDNSSSAISVYASDQGDSRAPQLIISYDETTATGCVAGTSKYQVEQQTDNIEENPNGDNNTQNQLNFSKGNNNFIGLRFQNIKLPQGAAIQSAYIEFVAAESRGNNSSKMTIRGIAKDDVGEFNYTDKDQVKNAPKTGATVNWNSIGSWNKNSAYATPDLTSIVQEIVDRSNWSPGNSIGFAMSDLGNQDVAAYTYQGSASRSPVLYIQYTGNAVPGRSSTVRDYLISRVNELTTDGYTPIVDTLYEAAMYYGGREVYYGLERGVAGQMANSVRRKTRVSHIDSYVGSPPVRPNGCSEFDLSSSKCIDEKIPAGATYISPVTDLQCQTNNHIVLLSDGRANNNHSVDEIEALLGTKCRPGTSGGEACGLDLVKNMKDPGTSKIGATVTTHTIGFAAGNDAEKFLDNLAKESGGGFYTADDSKKLLEVFKNIFRQVTDVNTTFVSPGVAVNQLNRLNHRDDLYYALFRPEEGTLWPGNLKKYKILGGQVVDADDKPAVDSSTGFFNSGAKSIWSGAKDGNDVRLGGAASRLTLSRKLYVFDNTPGIIATSNNQLNEANTSITIADLAVQAEANPAASREEVLKWARGVDVKDANGDGSRTDVNFMLGDPIHTEPLIVNYSTTDSAIFIATNHGFIHSIDAATGDENFAVMPRELLSNLHDIYSDRQSNSHIYGIDGDIVYREDPQSGQKIIYVGMRRGGNNYYAIDVTSKTSPKLVFTIDGGNGDFANLGQSWSKPIVTKVNIGGTVKDVLIFGGGYDNSQDNKTVRSDDTVGNSVFMVDADTGALLWSASNANASLNLPDMKYSIPAQVAVIDRDVDGLADHMYVADMGGQIFRLDIYNSESTANLVKGDTIAKLGGDTPENNRRFYYNPDVSEIVLGDEQYYAIAIGSGLRAGPLDTTIDDDFYMIKDKGVFQRDSGGNFTFPTTAFTKTELYDATDHLLTSSDKTQRDLAAQDFANKEGWFIRLTTSGEKVLSSPLILDYKVFFTTYIPASSSTSACAPPTGNSRAYLVDLLDGNSVINTNPASRYAEVKQPGIAPKPRILITSDSSGGGSGQPGPSTGGPILCLGANCTEAYPDPNQGACGSQYECLVQEIFARPERVQKDAWTTEVERQ